MSDKQYSDEMRFALFKNDKKGNERAPEYKGSMVINGQKYWLSAWLREAKSGQKFMSGAIQLAEVPPQPAPAPAPQPAAPKPMADLEDDVPF